MTESWQVVSLRLTGFLSAPLTARPDWWDQVVGIPPTLRQESPGEGNWFEVGALALEGFERSQLTLQGTPVRVNWSAEAAPPEPEEELLLGTPIAPFPAGFVQFEDFISKWLDIAPDLSRLAFGAALHIPEETHEAAYKRLSRYLPFPLDGTETDLVFRINRPKDIEIPGAESKVRINRLTTWSVLRTQLRVFQMAVAEKAPPVASSRVTSQALACRVEFDFNNVPEDRPLSSELLKPLLHGLIMEAIQVAQEERQQ